MIQNPKIIEKLDAKTLGDSHLRDFILQILENESEGKQYSKFYAAKIKEAVNLRQQEGK